MPIYEYVCRTCHHYEYDTEPADTIGPCTTDGCPGELKRKFSFSVERPMQEHINSTTKQPVSSMRQFREQLKKMGDDYTKRTGIEVNYQPVDPDPAKLKVTGEGLDATNRKRVEAGLTPVKLPGII